MSGVPISRSTMPNSRSTSSALGGVAGKGAGAGLGAERAELFDLACGERNPDALAREQPRQRCAQSLAGADDQGSLVFWHFHGRGPRMVGLDIFRRAIPQGNPRPAGSGQDPALVGYAAYFARSMPSDRA